MPDRPEVEEFELIQPEKENLKILFHDYKVFECANLVNDHNDFGMFDGLAAHILLANNLPKKMYKEVLIHEVVEAYNYHMELELEHNQITGISTMFTDFMLDNPDFIRRFLKEGKRVQTRG